VLFLPPPTEKLSSLAKIVGLSIAVASVALLIYQQARQKDGSEQKKLNTQYP
jgi:hypothetical protein